MPFDKSQPIQIKIGEHDGGVVLDFEGFRPFAVEPEMARTIAENLLRIVGRIQGREFMLFSADYSWSTVDARKKD